MGNVKKGRLNTTRTVGEGEGTREQWLTHATTELFGLITTYTGLERVPVRVSVGLPSVRAMATKNRAVGQCWPPSRTADGVSQIFISPVVDDGLEVLGVLAHELVHALTPGEGHGRGFARVAVPIGLTPPMSATGLSDGLKIELRNILDALGPYPHAKLKVELRQKQTTRMLKVKCPGCGYVARTTEYWLNQSVPYHWECQRFFERCE